jgi:hypothetical protein
VREIACAESGYERLPARQGRVRAPGLPAGDRHRSGRLAQANDLLRVRGADPPPGPLGEFRARLAADPIANSVLDPLVPAIVAEVGHWGPVAIAHDRQTQLPPRRLQRIAERCGGDLLGVRFLDAESHPEIQIADILAGTVRRITEDGDPAPLRLLPPYVSA